LCKITNKISISDIYALYLKYLIKVSDNRPHFAGMGQKCKHEDPESREKVRAPEKFGGLENLDKL